MTSRSSKSPGKETKTLAGFVEEGSNLPPVCKRRWEKESHREIPGMAMATAWFGIVFAAGLYPIVVSVFFFVFMLFTDGVWFVSDDFGRVFVGLIFAFVFGSFLGMIMTVPAYILLVLFRWVSGGVISERVAIGVYGGLTGFLCTTGGGIIFANHQGGHVDSSDLYFGLLFPLLAIVMGHAGAVWAGYRNRDGGFPYFEPLFEIEQQFTIAFLMRLTVFVAVLAVICKAAGNAGLAIGALWGVYVVVQGCLLLCDHWLQKRLRGRPL